MKTIMVASTNPVKIASALAGFQRMFPDEQYTVQGISVASGVSDQPMSDAETMQGAINRAESAQQREPDADYWVGIEGGVDSHDGALQAFAWIVVMGGGHIGKSRTAAYYLPEETASLVRQGIELGDADDQVFGRSNSKQQNGSVGLLTGDVIDRTAYYVQAVILALIPFKNSQFTF